MRKIEVESLSDDVNHAVLRLPPRKFPGMLIQGDSMRILLDELEEALDELSRNEVAHAREGLELVAKAFRDRLTIYEGALKLHGYDLPYEDR